ncbi:Crp/Fnr family transcriptional regulator [Chryseolinea sp. T2]|uniref:Crp/Fnr family transcriptional regulator n=1 Tax=Chryseolinea sp. T2 TaxID=3129255 RepID=UPI0030775F7F
MSHKQHLGLEMRPPHEILKRFYSLSAAKNVVLLRSGDQCDKLYYLLSGCVRTYFIDEQGVEKTSSVTLPNNFVTAWSSFVAQSVSLEFIEALENSELLVIDYQELHRLKESDNQWREFYLKLLEAAVLTQSRKIEALMTLNAQQRYSKLLNGNPKLIQNVSNRVLASFLDMREETLSRLKSRK